MIFEGGGDSDFDQRVTATLFPELQQQANLISGSNKVRVRALHETLQSAAQKGLLPFKFYSVTDRDSGPELSQSSSVNTFTWDVYHIENYFLEPKYIHQVLGSLGGKGFPNDAALWDELRQCAQDTLPQIVRHELSEFANSALVGAIDTGTDPKGADLTGLLFAAIERSISRLDSIRTQKLNKTAIAEQEKEIKAKYVESLADGTWVNVFRGRDVMNNPRLKARVSDYGSSR